MKLNCDKRMGTTGLMLGDWLLNDIDKEVGRESEITQDEIEIDVCLQKEGQYHWINGNMLNFSGIPLTDEMLEYNGFYVAWETNSLKNTHLDYKEYFDPKSDISLACNKTRGYGIVIGHNTIYFKYVHELQHLLRFCGLDDIADGFKID